MGVVAQSHSDGIPRQNRSISRLRSETRLDRREKPAKLRGDLLCLAEMGGDPHAVLHGSGTTLEEVLSQTPIACSMIADLFDRLAKATPVGFGVVCGRSIRLHYLGMLGYRLSNCGTIGELLSDWARYSVIIGYPLGSTLTIDGPVWKMVLRPRYPLSRDALAFCAESTLSGFTQSLFNMTGRRIKLKEAAFPFARPLDPSIYDGIDARHVSFSSPTTFVTGWTRDLGLPIATSDPVAREVCDIYCRETLSDLTGGETFEDRLRATIARVGTQSADEQCVSQVMRVSTRTMQRNLAAEGLSFHRVIDEMRRDRAIALIEQGCANKTIAHDLGYSDIASFYRAFRRWTGERPSAWRVANERRVDVLQGS